ncbi:MAG: DNA mismatch repair endonuclease MutL [Peptococcaceae bacterium]|jgi:DNA mismatch repair protein MutL|nr:DNA mismatch repair endonuclease MutL [Peptococcaceae bacterium]
MSQEPRIQRLDDLTANQIAAGEVIERPVSVVKELLENAIDAGGRRIRIEIRDGGLALIRVIDDGAGIASGDLPLAVERHATSKLRVIGDLDDLATLGFRGEALASIASVAALEIVTRREDSPQGSRLWVKGEAGEPEISKAGCPQGTRITVEHLFFNTPARLKFMRSAGYEGGLIHDLVIQLALGYPAIDFSLESQGKIILDTAGINSQEDLVELFYGREARQALLPVDAEVSRARLRGWITAPPYSRGTRKGYHIYINGRRIDARDSRWAIEQAFAYLLPKGRFPLAILHFQLPGSLLDVNVHPGKLEVRINDPHMYAALTRALRLAVSGGQLLPDAGGLGGAAGGSGAAAGAAGGGSEADGAAAGYVSGGAAADSGRGAAPGWAATGGMKGAAPGWAAAGGGRGGSPRASGLFPAGGGEGRAGRPVEDWQKLYAFLSDDDDASLGENTAGQGFLAAGERLLGDWAGAANEPGAGGRGEATGDMGSLFAALEARATALPPGQWGVNAHNRSLRALLDESRPEDFFFGPDIAFRVIGQLRATFILAETAAGLLVADQHVAHERILYERLLAAAGEKESAQMLLTPIQLRLTLGEEETLIRHILLLNDLGLIAERFGSREYLLRSSPAGRPIDEAMFKELLEKLAAEGKGSGPAEARQALLVMQSCKGAVKANTVLSLAEMTALLAGLQKTAHPMTCPHGRPILYLLPYHRLLRAFGRS